MSETQSAARCPGYIQKHCENMENPGETQDSNPPAVPPSPKPRHSVPRDTGEDTGNKPGRKESESEENNNDVGEERTPTNSPDKDKGGDEEEKVDKNVDKVSNEDKNDLENKESRDKKDDSGNIPDTRTQTPQSDTRTPTPRPRSNLNNNANSNVDQNQKAPLAGTNNPDVKSVGADPGKPGDKEDKLLNKDASQSDPDNTQTNLDREQDSKVPNNVQEKSLTKQDSKRDLKKAEPVSWEIDLSDKGATGSSPVAGTGDQATGSSKVSPAPSGGSKTESKESVASVSDIMLGNMDFSALPIGRKSTPKNKATFSGQSTLVDRYIFILHTLRCLFI